jgi:hypothetical protein
MQYGIVLLIVRMQAQWHVTQFKIFAQNLIYLLGLETVNFIGNSDVSVG